jgi:hypothetical protein
VSQQCGVPRVFVETGTYRGRTTEVAAECFDVVHTIELSNKWYRATKHRLRHFANVHCHFGDSAKVLDQLVKTIDEPVVFFLDAHYSGGSTAHGQEEVPLLRELKIIGTRRHADMIIVDDARLMGEKGTAGGSSSEWPAIKYDWTHITPEAIQGALGELREMQMIGDLLLVWRS